MTLVLSLSGLYDQSSCFTYVEPYAGKKPPSSASSQLRSMPDPQALNVASRSSLRARNFWESSWALGCAVLVSTRPWIRLAEQLADAVLLPFQVGFSVLCHF